MSTSLTEQSDVSDKCEFTLSEAKGLIYDCYKTEKNRRDFEQP